MNTANQLVEFMKIMETLCLVKRDNFLSKGGEESDSDHIFKLAFSVILVYPYLKEKVDYTRMLEIALIHDIVEARSGDFSLSAQTPEIKSMKKQKEKEAIEHYKTILPSPLNEKIYDIFMEYEEKSSREAKLVWCLDKLDALHQANLYNGGDIKYWADCPNGDWYYTYAVKEKELIKELDEDILKELEQIFIKITKDNLKKCNIQVEKTA